jgi:hypothetical protein
MLFVVFLHVCAFRLPGQFRFCGCDNIHFPTSTDSRELQVVNKEMVADVGHLAMLVQGWKGRYHPVPQTKTSQEAMPWKYAKRRPDPEKAMKGFLSLDEVEGSPL